MNVDYYSMKLIYSHRSHNWPFLDMVGCELKYTKPRIATTTPTLHGTQGEPASSIDKKETLVRETTFPQAPGDNQEVEIPQGSWHSQIVEELVRQALFHQAVQKAPGIDQLNFQALQLLWEWDSPRIVALA